MGLSVFLMQRYILLIHTKGDNTSTMMRRATTFDVAADFVQSAFK